MLHVTHFWYCYFFFFFSSRRRHTRFDCDWSSDVCSSDLLAHPVGRRSRVRPAGGGEPPPPVGPGDHPHAGIGSIASGPYALDRKSGGEGKRGGFGGRPII